MGGRTLAASLALILALGETPALAARLAAPLAGTPVRQVSLARALPAPAAAGAVSAAAPRAPARALPGLRMAAAHKLPSAAAAAAMDGTRLARGSAVAAPAPDSWRRPLPPARSAKTEKKTVPRPGLPVPLAVGAAAGVIGAVLWNAVSFVSFSDLPWSYAIAAGIIAAVIWLERRLIRVLRGKPFWVQRPPVRRSTRAALLLAAIVAGTAVGAGAYPVKTELWARQSRIEAPEERLERLPAQFNGLVLNILRSTEEGRDILSGLSDPLGTPRLPAFFVSVQKNTGGLSHDRVNAIALARPDGWTGSPADLRELAKDAEFTIVHELRHAEQSRRHPFSEDYGKRSKQEEHQAYLSALLHLHERLSRNPGAEVPAWRLWDYESMLSGLDAWWKSAVSGSLYKDNEDFDTPYYRAYYARMRAEWPRVSVQGYLNLARRDPALAETYLQKARDRAAEHNLPVPKL